MLDLIRRIIGLISPMISLLQWVAAVVGITIRVLQSVLDAIDKSSSLPPAR